MPGATATVRGVECAVWHRREDDYAVDGNFVGEYWYYASIATGAPARFSMLGHNVITNSHFDNYTWEYLELVDRALVPLAPRRADPSELGRAGQREQAAREQLGPPGDLQLGARQR